MSYDDKSFMARGFRVRHKYKKRHGCHGVCVRCGVKRRSTSSGWEYLDPKQRAEWVFSDGSKIRERARWTSTNPPCIKRE